MRVTNNTGRHISRPTLNVPHWDTQLRGRPSGDRIEATVLARTEEVYFKHYDIYLLSVTAGVFCCKGTSTDIFHKLGAIFRKSLDKEELGS